MHALLKRKLANLKDLDRPSYKPVLLHADLCGEHIFVNEADGALQGIVDWSEARVGDPCIDIAGISLAVGRNMAMRIGLKAGYSMYTVEKGLLLGMCWAIVDLCDRICGRDSTPELVLRSQFKRAFEGEGVENVLGTQ